MGPHTLQLLLESTDPLRDRLVNCAQLSHLALIGLLLRLVAHEDHRLLEGGDRHLERPRAIPQLDQLAARRTHDSLDLNVDSGLIGLG